MKINKLDENRIEEVRLNNHQQHFEDLVLFGKEGLNELNDKIDKFLRRFEGGQGELNLTQKIDGAPALFCWSKFPGYPYNSIALKGFTSGPNTALSTPEQIDDKYGDRPDMAEKLKYGLELSRYIPKGECWQGDCLFTQDDLREEEINGQFYLTFQPNKIVYAFKESDPNYEDVKNADFGIAFHTIYRSAGNGEKSQSFNVDAKRINAPDNFYIMSPAINASKDKNDYKLDNLKSTYEGLKVAEEALVNDPAYEDLVNNSAFMNYWNTFENANLADKKQTNLNVSTLIKDLKSYVRDKQDKEYAKKLDKLKTDKGRQGATDKYNKDVQELSDIIENNTETILNLVNALNTAANIKMMMWSGLKNVKNDYSTYYKSRTKGYIPAEGEGIAMSDNDGNIVKIVDRSTFSSYNRDPDIMSGFEHESLDMINSVFDINEDLEKTAVVAFGRMNPPTIGHNKLIDKMASLGGEPKLYLSHSQNDKKDPLPYESKIKWCKKAFGDRVDVVESPARNAFEVLHDLYEEGYTDIIYVGGEDRIGGEGDISASIKKYNGVPDKKGNIIYDFNSITFENAGARNPDSNDPKEQASASLVRKLALENNFNEFKKYVPFDANSAFALYKELRKAMTGKEESFLEACNRRIEELRNSTLNEDNNNVNGAVMSILKRELSKKLNDVEFKQLNYQRHPLEVLRIKPDVNVSVDELKDKIKNVLNILPKDIINNEYKIDNINFNDIGIHDGASREYDSIPVIIKSIKDNSTIELYITLAAGKKSIYKKMYTPSNVIEPLDKDKRFDELIFKEGFENFKEMYYQAISTATGDLNHYTATIKNMPELPADAIDSIMNDFGEVLSAGCLAKVLGDPGLVFFPSASNEGLIDFAVNGSIKVSQKAKTGAAPSGTTAFTLINKGDFDKKVVLKANGFNNNDIRRVLNFIDFMSNYVYSVDIHEGYVNLANLAIGKIQNNWLNVNAQKFSNYFKERSVNRSNIVKFTKEISNEIHSNLKFDPNRVSDRGNWSINSSDYCETIRIRYLARLAISAINNDNILIEGFNYLLSAGLGEFIQVYLKNKNEFMKGHLIFDVKKLDNHSKYEFADGSYISPKDNKLSTKRLSIKLK